MKRHLPIAFPRLLQVACGVALWCFLLQTACGPPTQCNTCTPGQQQCDSQSGALLVCATGFDSSCSTWGSIPCPAGGACQVTNGVAACGGGTACPNACTLGAARCDGDGVVTCSANLAGSCPGWSQAQPCPSGQFCAKGACSSTPPTCPGACVINTLRCAGNATQTCIQGTDPCPIWGSAVDCKATTICQAGKCEDNCKNLCSVGQLRCSGASIQSCVADKASGCPLWGKPLQCPDNQRCEAGACKATTNCPTPTCTDGAKQCQANGLQTCTKDAKGCLAWGAATPCALGQTCTAGKCEGQCQDACADKVKQCDGAKIQTCGKGPSGCLSWGAAAACPANQSCQGGVCKPGCTDACADGKTQCKGAQIQTCKRAANSCLAWGAAAACPANQSCQGGACKPTCSNACTAGQKRCQGNSIQTCSKDAKGCLVWGGTTACASGETCDTGKCVNLGDPSQRPQQTVCARWKKDYPTTAQPGFTNSPAGSCNAGKISQGSIDDAIRRISLYRWLIGLPPTAEDKALSDKTQSCAILQANNDGPGGGVNAHKPPTSWKCYNTIGGQTSGASNLSWGVGHPADTISQYISDHQVASLGHRLWIISAGFAKTGIGLATGTGRYKVASCLYTFARGTAAPIDFIAYPPPGFIPIQAMGTRHPVKDWSFTSTKYKVSGLTEVIMTRKSDGDVQKIKPRKISSYGHPAGLSWRPRTPKAGETYTVKFGTIYSYTVKFFDCQ